MTLASAISAYGASLKSKLSNPAIGGQPEDQLRGPLDSLILELANLGGVVGKVDLVGETSLSDLKTRPDFAVTVGNALVGFIEVKAPGKGADPRHFTNPHDKDQWSKLKSLPNLLYTDGSSFSLWRDGAIAGKVVSLEGDVETAGGVLTAPDGLLPLIADFLTWKPQSPPNARRLAEVSARLCRLLRDEVAEQLDRGSEGLTTLAKDWRKLLFPEADNAQFADGYAQAVTFGLLVARALDIPLDKGIHQAAHELRKTNSLIGTALNMLTDDEANQKALETSLKTLTRVLNEVNWHTISKDKPEAWLYFYEQFLEVYDNRLRKRTGSYYTPPEVVSAMARLVDEALRGPLFERHAGLASPDVVLADPAVGTGTFLLGVLRHIADSVRAAEGEGAVHGAVEAAAKRLIGFELQFGPFAVAQLRLMAEIQSLLQSNSGQSPHMPEMRLFITDTLGNPYIEEETLAQAGAIAKSRRDANTVKKTQEITVVLGNPPYKEKAKGRGGWVEAGAGGKLKALMDWWTPPAAWGVGAHTKHLKNLYVFFWRWATWKVFGTGNYAATGYPDKDDEGIVCFISAAGFLNGPGFEKMRDDLRRTCSAIWVIDCSPEGHQPDVATRIFQGVQQPVCIVLAAKKFGRDKASPAPVRFTALPKGRREEKFKALETLGLEGSGWVDAPNDWRAPFFPAATGAWATFPSLLSFFEFRGPGVLPGRAWAISPDKATLAPRWARLIGEKNLERKEVLFRPQLRHGKPASRHIRKIVAQPLGQKETRHVAIADDNGPMEDPVRYAYRSFDRQWLIGDARLLNDVRPELWRAHSPGQVFLTALEASSPSSGPAITFTELIPDQDHFKGSFGGRVHPLWRDPAAKQPNIPPKLLGLIADVIGPVSAEDVMAYLAGVMAHPAFTVRFQKDLKLPGLRVPLTADPALFAEAVALGREVIWLHTYGERFADPAAGRPKGPPKMATDAPTIPAGGAIPGAPEPLPDTMEYDAVKRRLHVGKGYIDNVTPEMWNYEVSGKQVVWHWFSYRKRDRTRPQIGDKRPPSPLDSIQPDHWLAEYTTDLIALLNVLGRLVALEAPQADLMERILKGELIKLSHIEKELADGGATVGASE